MIATPGRLNLRADWCLQLATMLQAGVTLPAALDTARSSLPRSQDRSRLQRAAAALAQGSTFAEALQAGGPWLPEFDLAIIKAGEDSGRLDVSLGLLAEVYRDAARLRRVVRARLAYPVFLFHAAVFIAPFPELFLTGNGTAYGRQTLGVLLPVYALVWLGLYACRGGRGRRWRLWLERIARRIPAVGVALRHLALARLAHALEALLSAGFLMIPAWELAARASGSPLLDLAVCRWRPALESGATPAELVRASGEFPANFASLYHAGEISGQLDRTLRGLYRFHQEEAVRLLEQLAEWLPRLVYVAVAGYVVTRIFGLYGALPR